MTFTTEDKLKAVRREIAMRKNVFRKKVHDGRMKQEEMDREIGVMEAIAADYAPTPTVTMDEVKSDFDRAITGGGKSGMSKSLKGNV